jgi:hypothetical protein
VSAGSFDLAYNRLSGVKGTSYLKPLIVDNISITLVAIVVGVLLGFNLYLVFFLLTQRVLNFYGLAFRALNSVLLERKVYIISSFIKLLLYAIVTIFEVRLNLFLLFLALSDLSCLFYSNRLSIANSTQVNFLQIQKEKLAFIGTNALSNLLISLPVLILNRLSGTKLFIEAWSYMEHGLKILNIVFSAEGSLRLRSLIQNKQYESPKYMQYVPFLYSLLGFFFLYYLSGSAIIYTAVCLAGASYMSSAIVYPLVYALENFRLYNIALMSMIILFISYYIYLPEVTLSMTVLYPTFFVLINFYLVWYYKRLWKRLGREKVYSENR